MGRKISNRLYSSFWSSFGLIFLHALVRRRDSLFWNFCQLEILLTPFISIYVCFTPHLIFLEPLKLVRWNFYSTCTDDWANFVFSHSWLAPIGAKGGGSKYGLNFGIFKNHSQSPRGGQISTGRFQIYTYGGGWPFTYFLPPCDSRKFPQPVSLSFFGQNSKGYIPAIPWYIDIKFAGYIDTIAVCGRKVSKLVLPPKFRP